MTKTELGTIKEEYGILQQEYDDLIKKYGTLVEDFVKLTDEYIAIKNSTKYGAVFEFETKESIFHPIFSIVKEIEKDVRK